MRVTKYGVSSRLCERTISLSLWCWCLALFSVVVLAGAAVAGNTSHDRQLAAKPTPASSKPKSQQDMMKMLDDYEQGVSQSGGRPGAQRMSPQGMGRGNVGQRAMMGQPGMSSFGRGMPMGGGFAGRGMQPRPVGNSSGVMLQALKQKFERMRQNQPGIMQMLQGQMQAAEGGGMPGGGMPGGGMAGGGQAAFMQMLQQKMQQAPPRGQVQRFGQSAPGMNPAMMGTPRLGGGMSRLGAPQMMPKPGMAASPPGGSFSRLGNPQRSSSPASKGSLSDLESQMNAQYGN